MATKPPAGGYVVDISTDPWFTGQLGNGTGSYDFSQVNLPGMESFYTPASGNGDNMQDARLNSEAFSKWLQDNGYVYKEARPDSRTYARWIEDKNGNVIADPQWYSETGNFFRDALLLIAGGYAAGSWLGAAGGTGVASAGGAAAGTSAADLGIGATYGAVDAGAMGGGSLLTGGGEVLSGMDLAADAGTNAYGWGQPAVAGGGTTSALDFGGFNPEGITNPNFGSGADFAAVSPMNGGGYSSLMSSLGGYSQLARGLAGLYYANTLSRLGKGSGSSRAAEAQLTQLLQDPNSITSMPGYQAGLDAVERKAAGSGYLGSGNLKIALAKYGGDFYNDTVARLSGIANANYAANQQYRIGGIQLFGQSLNSLGYGLSQLGFGG